MRGWLEVRLSEDLPYRRYWVVLRNELLLFFRAPSEQCAELVLPLQTARLTQPAAHGLSLSVAQCQCLLRGEGLRRWHDRLSTAVADARRRQRLSVLYANRMRFSQTCKLNDMKEISSQADYMMKDKGRVERAHRLRELSLLLEEELAWASLPEVISTKFTDMLTKQQLQCSELVFRLVLREVVFSQELSGLLDLARASVRWQDTLPLFNRRSIIGCALKVKKCSDNLVRRLEEEWSPELASDGGRVFAILEASLDAAAAQTYVSYCEVLDDARALVRRATEKEYVVMSGVVSVRCHVELALLPLQRLGQLKARLEQLRTVLPSCQQLLQCQQLLVTVTGMLEHCFKVLTSLHGSNYVSEIENVLDFSNKLLSLRQRRDLGPLPPLPESPAHDPQGEDKENYYSATPTLRSKTESYADPQLNGSFNLIDLRSMENLQSEVRMEGEGCSGSNSPQYEDMECDTTQYEAIELKDLSRTGDGRLLQKSFQEQPLYQAYGGAGKGLPDIESQVQSKSIFYAYLDLTDNVYEDVSDSPKSGPFQPLRTLWCETDEVVNSGLLDKLTPSQIALQESKFEILTSEVSYLKSLNILITLFVESKELKEILSVEDRQNLFSNILEVRKASEMFLFDLAGQWEQDWMLPDVCSLVLKHSQAGFRAYVAYCSNQLRFHRTLQRLLLDRLRFTPVLGTLEALPECQGYSLQSFLMLPVQRVTRLPLLVQAVQRRLAADTAEHAACRVALTAVNQLVHECNEGVRANEQSEQIQALSQILHDSKETEENKINSTTPNKPEKEKQKKRRHSWKIFSSQPPSACDT